MKAELKLEKKTSYFPNAILEYKNQNKDVLFYCLTECILSFGHNTEPETLCRIADDTEFKIYDKKEVLAAQLILTYFETN